MRAPSYGRRGPRTSEFGRYITLARERPLISAITRSRYHLGGPRWHESGLEVIPFEEAVTALDQLL